MAFSFIELRIVEALVNGNGDEGIRERVSIRERFLELGTT